MGDRVCGDPGRCAGGDAVGRGGPTTDCPNADRRTCIQPHPLAADPNTIADPNTDRDSGAGADTDANSNADSSPDSTSTTGAGRTAAMRGFSLDDYSKYTAFRAELRRN